MADIYDDAKAAGYNATRFLVMIREHGGFETARRLLASSDVSYGFTELFMLGRTDLTVEALVLKPAFRGLFTDQELSTARDRLGLKADSTPAHPDGSKAPRKTQRPLGLRHAEHPEAKFESSEWAGPDGEVGSRVLEKSRQALQSYREDPLLVDEHANKELGTAQGGYGRRQIYELVQNAADELLVEPGGTIKLLLTDRALYCANQGAALSVQGVNALLMSDLSVKRGNEIGRFGLGFKSVLAITNRPTFISKSGSFRFDPEAAGQNIRKIAPHAERVPWLRTATAIDPLEASASDTELRDLMRWATTVVKLPLDEPASGFLHEDLVRFPAEFLLFSPHVGRVIAEDLTTGLYREMRVEPEQDGLRITEGAESVSWRTFRKDHRPSAAARADAGEIAGREVVPVIWAVRRSGRAGRGQFWAFFPTEAGTTLSGIVNAPWKTNEDRQNLLVGDFNTELVDIVAELVADNLERLSTQDDPGRMFDILPARGREAQSWADERLTEKVYELAAERPSVPDQEGRLVHPTDVYLPPAELPDDALEVWASSPDRQTNWLHRSAESRERRPRVERLVPKARIQPLRTWLEAAVPKATPAGSRAAVLAAAACDRSKQLRQVDAADIRRAHILLTTTGGLRTLDPASVFLGSPSQNETLAAFVHASLQADPSVSAALHEFGFAGVDREAEYGLYLDRLTIDYRDWDRFWEVTSQLEESRALSLILGRTLNVPIHVRTCAGTYARSSDVLLPGEIVPEGGGLDAPATLDVGFHRRSESIVRTLGVVAGPSRRGGRKSERWYRDYKDFAFDRYAEATKSLRQRPSREYLVLSDHELPGPFDVAQNLSRPGSAKFADALLRSGPDDRGWSVRHATKLEYPVVPVEDPTTWFLRRRAFLPTSRGPRRASEAVGASLAEFGHVLAVVEADASWDERLELPTELSALSHEVLAEALSRCHDVDPAVAAAFYAAACPHSPVPAEVRCIVGGDPSVVSVDDVVVTADGAQRDAAVDAETAVVFVDSEAQAAALVRHWGLVYADVLASASVSATPIGEPQLLVEAFPALRAFLARRDAGLELVRCTDLYRESAGRNGKRSFAVDFLVHEGTIYAAELSDRALLERVNDHFALGFVPADLDAILDDLASDRRQRLLLSIRDEPSAPLKLLRAVGEQVIVRHLNQSLLAAVEATRGALDAEAIANLAESVYGIDLFKEFKEDLARTGLNPPERWSGSATARRFVQSIGLPRAYAGFEEPRKDPLLDIDGPAQLPELHDFQDALTGRIRRHLKDQTGRRALLSLPTGAGKTRVTVEALVRAFAEDGLEGPVLWTAPTGELCEQAVQTWAYVWRAVGPSSRLHISRLWEHNEAEEPSDDGFHVVVATDAKMGIVIEKPEYEWLSNASVVIVDEAHGSTETGYTQIFHWLGLGREQSADRCPLIGLTATPFKGISVEATERLARRYGSRRLDDGVLGADPIRKLQDMGVLARARQQVLGGVTIDLTPEQANYARERNRLPQDVEQRVGDDRTRTQIILAAVRALPEDWKILVFAASVAHAEQMAALLNLDRIPAAVISASTNPAARRHYVRNFNAGSIRVLTNYGVLAEGFDAPSVRAVVIGRPTLSPNVYQQMIGRGLRGPKNGGKEECLIVNLADNILHFGGDLAFRHFDYLFDEH